MKDLVSELWAKVGVYESCFFEGILQKENVSYFSRGYGKVLTGPVKYMYGKWYQKLKICCNIKKIKKIGKRDIKKIKIEVREINVEGKTFTTNKRK